jgi:Bacterial Ig-like domain (group 2)
MEKAMEKNCWIRLAGLSAIIALALFVPGCGRSQELESIGIQPSTETFGATNIPVSADAGLSVQLRALGSYIHPPVVKDITNQVTWSSNTPTMVTVSATGLVTATGMACGNAIVSATVRTNGNGNRSSSGAIVTATMAANVVCFTTTGG